MYVVLRKCVAVSHVGCSKNIHNWITWSYAHVASKRSKQWAGCSKLLTDGGMSNNVDSQSGWSKIVDIYVMHVRVIRTFISLLCLDEMFALFQLCILIVFLLLMLNHGCPFYFWFCDPFIFFLSVRIIPLLEHVLLTVTFHHWYIQDEATWVFFWSTFTSTYVGNTTWYNMRGVYKTWRGVLDTTVCDRVRQWLAAGWWFSPGTLVSSTNKSHRHDTTEILLKVALNTRNHKPYKM